MPDRGRFLVGVGSLRERATLDIVVIIFVVVTALVIVATVLTLAILEIRDATVDTSDVVGLLDAHIGTIIGALLGLIAGQASGRVSAATPPAPPATEGK